MFHIAGNYHGNWSNGDEAKLRNLFLERTIGTNLIRYSSHRTDTTPLILEVMYTRDKMYNQT